MPSRWIGQADLAGGDGAGQVAEQLGEEVGDDRGGKPGGVGVDEEEEGLVGQEGPAFLQQLPEVVLEAPDFARAPAAVGRRVHDDGVVAAAALHLAPDELEAVVGDVADGLVGEAAEGRVLLAPLDHALGGVDVADGGARRGRRAGRRAGVAEEVEDAHAAAGRP